MLLALISLGTRGNITRTDFSMKVNIKDGVRPKTYSSLEPVLFLLNIDMILFISGVIWSQ